MFESIPNPTNRALLRNAAVLLLAAAVLFGVVGYFFAGMNWTPLRLPLELVEGAAYSGKFTASWGVPYEIRLDTERRLDLQEHYCLLGLETVVAEKCKAIPSQLDLAWVVSTDGEVVVSGVSGGPKIGYWGPTMGVILGSVDTFKGQSYEVTVMVQRSSDRLQVTNPHLVVTVAARARTMTYVWKGLLIVFASFAGLLAILLSVVVVTRSVGGKAQA